MSEGRRVSGVRARHFDPGSALARWTLGGAVLLVACSGSLKPGDPGTAGVGGDAGGPGTAGVGADAGAAAGGDAGYGPGGT
jgi:hypothetical protein